MCCLCISPVKVSNLPLAQCMLGLAPAPYSLTQDKLVCTTDGWIWIESHERENVIKERQLSPEDDVKMSKNSV